MPRHRFCSCGNLVLASLVVGTGGYTVNAPSCSSNIAAVIGYSSILAEALTRSISNCIPSPGRDENACAGNLASVATNIAKVSANIVAASYNCGGIDTGCPQAILDGMSDWGEVAEDGCVIADVCVTITDEGVMCAAAILAIAKDFVSGIKNFQVASLTCKFATSPGVLVPGAGGNATEDNMTIEGNGSVPLGLPAEFRPGSHETATRLNPMNVISINPGQESFAPMDDLPERRLLAV